MTQKARTLFVGIGGSFSAHTWMHAGGGSAAHRRTIKPCGLPLTFVQFENSLLPFQAEQQVSFLLPQPRLSRLARHVSLLSRFTTKPQWWVASGEAAFSWEGRCHFLDPGGTKIIPTSVIKSCFKNTIILKEKYTAWEVIIKSTVKNVTALALTKWWRWWLGIRYSQVLLWMLTLKCKFCSSVIDMLGKNLSTPGMLDFAAASSFICKTNQVKAGNVARLAWTE